MFNSIAESDNTAKNADIYINPPPTMSRESKEVKANRKFYRQAKIVLPKDIMDKLEEQAKLIGMGLKPYIKKLLSEVAET